MPQSDKQTSFSHTGEADITSAIPKAADRNVRVPTIAILIIVLVVLGASGAVLKYLEEDARVRSARVGSPHVSKGALPYGRATDTAPSPTPTPQLSKEYIYAGSRLLAVEDANANAAPPADLAVWRPSNGTWYVLGGTGSQQVEQGWGLNGDTAVPGDYDGDGKTDFSIYRPSEGKWYIINSSDSSWSITEWGLSTDTPAPADYDGDGKTDRAVFRADSPSTGYASWYIVHSSDSSSVTIQYGLTNDTPAPADYDGDGKADIAVWRTSNTNFYAILTSDGSQPTIDFSSTGVPVSADYDGDGKADYALFDQAANPYATWHILPSQTPQTVQTVSWGLSGDTPVQNDYDGDGLCDIAVWRNSNGNWYIRQSAFTNSLRQVGWGLPGDTPVPAFYRR